MATNITQNIETLKNLVSSTATENGGRKISQLILSFDGNETEDYAFNKRFKYDEGEIWLTRLNNEICLCIGKQTADKTDYQTFKDGMVRLPIEQIERYFVDGMHVEIDGVVYTDPSVIFKKILDKFQLINYNGDQETIDVDDQSIISLKIDSSDNNIIKKSRNGVIVNKPTLTIDSNEVVDIEKASVVTVKISSNDFESSASFDITANKIKFANGVSVAKKIEELEKSIDDNKIEINEDINNGIQLNEKNGVVKGGVVLATNSGLDFDATGRLKVNIDSHKLNVGTLDKESATEYTLHEALILNKEELTRTDDGISLSNEVKEKLEEIDSKQDKFTTDDTYIRFENGVLKATPTLINSLQKLEGKEDELSITSNGTIGFAKAFNDKISQMQLECNQKATKSELDNLKTVVDTKSTENDLIRLKSEILEKLAAYATLSAFENQKDRVSDKFDDINNSLQNKADKANFEQLKSKVEDLHSDAKTALSLKIEGNALIVTHGSQSGSVDLSKFVATGLVTDCILDSEDNLQLVFDNGKVSSKIPIGSLVKNVTTDLAKTKSDLQTLDNKVTVVTDALSKEVKSESTLLQTKMCNLEVKMNDNDLEYSDDNEKLTIKINGNTFKTDIPVYKLEASDKSIEILNNGTSLNKINVQIASGDNALSCEQNGLFVQLAGNQKVSLSTGEEKTITAWFETIIKRLDKIEEKLNNTPVYRFTSPLLESAQDKLGVATVSLELDGESLTVNGGKLTVGTVDANG